MSGNNTDRGMSLGGLNMRRALLIARRDYLGYIKTWGFWISFFLPFIFGILGFVFSQLDLNFEPTRYETILDDTGAHKAAITAEYERDYIESARKQISAIAEFALSDAQAEAVDAILDKQGVDGVISYLNMQVPGLGDSLKLPKRTLVFVDPPANDIETLKTFIATGKTLMHKGEAVPLNGVLHIRKDIPIENSAPAQNVEVKDGEAVADTKAAEEDEPIYIPAKVTADYWSTQVTAQGMQSLTKRYFRDRAEDLYLKSGGLSYEGLDASRDTALELQSFDPTKTAGTTGEGQKVTNKDRLPYIVAGIMALVLWLTVFSGAYMLLTSMLEEKLNKLLEMMLATTNFGEIILGKLIGVAALTLTTMLPYILLGGAGVIGIILFGPADVSEPIRQAFTWKMMVFFPLFLILGYIFYGCLFIAMGALAESMQDAQTITTPIVMVLTLCVLIVPLGWNSPDSPLLIFASWFPLSAPFAAISRLPSDPPAWELFLSAGFLALLSIVVIILASRIFRYGVLSGAGVKGISLWFKRNILRRKNV